MEAELKAKLLGYARAYAGHRNLEMVTVARISAGDWRFYDRLLNESTITLRKYDEVMSWFTKNWPTDLDRPTLKGVDTDPDR